MNRRRVVVGLFLCCALVSCVFGAPNAVALKGTTAYECKPVSGKEGAVGFTDEHCTISAEKGKAAFEHVLIPAESTNVTITNHETEKNFPVVRMRSSVGLVKVELQAKKASACAKSAFKNTVNAQKQMEVAGEGCMEFSEITVSGISKCVVKEPIVANIFGNTEVEEVEKKPIGGTGYFPPGGGGEPFTAITFLNKGAESCSLHNQTFNITGSVRANMPFEEGKVDGPTLRFSTAQTEATLKLGSKSAGFEATLTARSSTGEKNPVSVTTTES
jgi:hypothetical protein